MKCEAPCYVYVQRSLVDVRSTYYCMLDGISALCIDVAILCISARHLEFMMNADLSNSRVCICIFRVFRNIQRRSSPRLRIITTIALNIAGLDVYT